jgi:hypothetical protein
VRSANPGRCSSLGPCSRTTSAGAPRRTRWGLPMLTAVPGQSTPGTGAPTNGPPPGPEGRFGASSRAGPSSISTSTTSPPARRALAGSTPAPVSTSSASRPGSRSSRCLATQRSPFPHISARLPSALWTTIRAAARLEGRSTSTPSAPTPRRRSQSARDAEGDRSRPEARRSSTTKSLPSPSYLKPRSTAPVTTLPRPGAAEPRARPRAGRRAALPPAPPAGAAAGRPGRRAPAPGPGPLHRGPGLLALAAALVGERVAGGHRVGQHLLQRSRRRLAPRREPPRGPRSATAPAPPPARPARRARRARTAPRPPRRRA